MTLESEHVLQEQQESQASHVLSALKLCTRGAAVIVLFVGSVALLSWMGRIQALESIRSGAAIVEVNTAVGFVLAGSSLWLRRARPMPLRIRHIADAGACIVVGIGLLTLLQYGLQKDFGIDNLLTSGAARLAGTLHPGRMAPEAAVLFVAAGMALLLLDIEVRPLRQAAQILLLLTCLAALAALIGYLYGGISRHRGAPYSGIAWPTALTFVVFGMGALCARPDRGIARVVASDAIGGVVARRLLPAAVVVPPILCILSYLGFAAKWYDVGMGLALLTTLNSAVLTTLVWRTAGTLNQTDRLRRSTEIQRNELNEALRQAHAFREKVMDSAVFAVVALDLEGRFTLVNRRMEEIAGRTHEDLIGQPFTILSLPDECNLVMERLRGTLLTGIPVYHMETQIVRKDGSVVTVAYGWSAMFLEDRIVGIVGTGEDITDRKRLEEQLFQARKLESIGRLAGGIAHDFNNLLTAILGYSELLEMELPASSETAGYTRNIQTAAERAAGLTGQLLAFARRQVIEPKIINLNDLILNLSTMLKRLIGEQITLVTQPAPGLHFVCMDPTQVEQILINLVINARDAIHMDGGRILVETSNVTLDDERTGQHETIAAGDYVMLAVSDTGSGMDEAVQLQIFEPFFTTKEKGRGTGLGLATVYGIVKQAGGHIWLYSEVGEGTAFKIYLPRAAEPTNAAAPQPPSPAPSRGDETLLVVEDEAAVRALTTSALRGLGYHVLEAEDGPTALRIGADYAGPIDLLITDVVMPHMSGKDLAGRLLSSRPALKVLYVSGYTENTIMHHGILEPGIEFLPKPFALSALSLKVREVLSK